MLSDISEGSMRRQRGQNQEDGSSSTSIYKYREEDKREEYPQAAQDPESAAFLHRRANLEIANAHRKYSFST